MNEIKSFLKSKGFKIFKLSNLDFKEQINIFNNAEIIIGPHGAGFANLVFCKKNTKVIELNQKIILIKFMKEYPVLINLIIN